MDSELTRLATTALAAAAPYLAKGGESAISEMGKDIWTLIKSMFQTQKEKELADRLERTPDNLKLHGKVELMLEMLLEQNSAFYHQLSAMVAEARDRTEAQAGGNRAEVSGDNNMNNMTVQGLVGSHLNVGRS